MRWLGQLRQLNFGVHKAVACGHIFDSVPQVGSRGSTF